MTSATRPFIQRPGDQDGPVTADEDDRVVEFNPWSLARRSITPSRMSQSATSPMWRAFGLKPHLVDTFKLATDAQVSCKVRDLVALYLHPPEAAMVLCVHEKTDVQALTAPPGAAAAAGRAPNARPMTTPTMAPPTWTPPGRATGKVISQLTARHRAVALKRCLGPGRSRSAGSG